MIAAEGDLNALNTKSGVSWPSRSPLRAIGH
jgi:hypothetical protein